MMQLLVINLKPGIRWDLLGARVMLGCLAFALKRSHLLSLSAFSGKVWKVQPSRARGIRVEPPAGGDG